MRRTCEKPGCGQPTAVVYGLEDGRDGSKVLWIEAVRPGAPDRDGARGTRCARHAETITAPVGWVVDDRRESVPRLFKPPADRSAVNRTAVDRTRADLRVVPTKSDANSEAKSEPKSEPKSRRERVGDLPRPKLFSDAVEPVVDTEPVEPVIVTVPVEPAIVTASVEPVVELTNESEPAERLDEPDQSGGVERDDSKSWVPFFDPDDDLDGMLNATGSMLRDAFRSRHNGRGRDQ